MMIVTRLLSQLARITFTLIMLVMMMNHPMLLHKCLGWLLKGKYFVIVRGGCILNIVVLPQCLIRRLRARIKARNP